MFARLFPNFLSSKNLVVFFIAASCGLFAIWVFLPSLANGYIWDDLIYLVNSTTYRDSERLQNALFRPFFISNSYYRPLVILSFLVGPATESSAPYFHHLANLLVHGVNVALCVLCAHTILGQSSRSDELRRSRGWMWALIWVGLFAGTQPVVLESTVWISGRYDQFLLLFLLLFLLFDHYLHRPVARFLILAALFFAASTSKESAIGFPPALMLIHLLKWRLVGRPFSWRDFARRNMIAYAAIFFAGLLYLFCRWYALGQLVSDNKVVITGTLADRLVFASMALGRFVAMVVAPWSLFGPLHPFDYKSLTSAEKILSVSVAAVTLLFLVAQARTKNWPLPLLIFCASIWPALHLVGLPNGDNLVADRYVVLPMYLLLICGVGYLHKLVERLAIQRVRLVGIVAILLSTGVFASFVAFDRVTIPLWRSENIFWAYAYRHAPTSLARVNYARTLIETYRYDEAVQILGDMFDKGDRSFITMTNLAAGLAAQGDLEQALSAIKYIEDSQMLSTTAASEHPTFYCVYSWIETKAGRYESALRQFRAAEAAGTPNLQCQLHGATLLFQLGEISTAYRELERIEKTAPISLMPKIDATRALFSAKSGSRQTN